MLYEDSALIVRKLIMAVDLNDHFLAIMVGVMALTGSISFKNFLSGVGEWYTLFESILVFTKTS